jgi:tight adherence protein B
MELAAIISIVGLAVAAIALYVAMIVGERERERAAGARLAEAWVDERPEAMGRRERSFFVSKAGGIIGRIERLTAPAGIRISVRALIATEMVLAVGGFAIAAIWLKPGVSIAAGIGVASAPVIYLRIRRQRRLKHLGATLPYVLDMLKSALESGNTLQRALQMAAQRNADTIGQELRIVMDQVRVGMTLPQALESMHQRVPIPELGFLATAVALQEQTGSNLAQLIERVSSSLRHRQQLDDQIRSLTSQSRAGAMIVSALPIVVLGAFSLIQTDYARLLFTNPTGVRLLEIAVVLDAIAFLLMRQIARVDY